MKAITRRLLKFLTATLVILLLAGVSIAKDWHGIVPLRSTRQEVKRLLGESSDENNFRANYYLILYFAPSEDRKMCPQYFQNPGESVQVGAPHPRKFDEWGDILFRDERARLDNAWAVLQQQGANINIYLVIYAGESACVGEAKARGIRAKNYLVRRRGTKPERIVWIDGGYLAEPQTEIWLLPPEWAPVPIGSPFTLGVDQVKLDKTCKIKYRGRRR